MTSQQSSPVITPLLEGFFPSHRQRGLNRDISPERIQEVLGSEIISRASRDGKCDFQWDFFADGVPCSIWDYSGSKWSCWGPVGKFELLFPGMVSYREIDINTIAHDLSPTQKFLLAWLVQEDESLLGECNGTDLDNLLQRSLAEKRDPDLGSYAKVSITDLGRRVLKQIDAINKRRASL